MWIIIIIIIIISTSSCSFLLTSIIKLILNDYEKYLRFLSSCKLFVVNKITNLQDSLSPPLFSIENPHLTNKIIRLIIFRILNEFDIPLDYYVIIFLTQLIIIFERIDRQSKYVIILIIA